MPDEWECKRCSLPHRGYGGRGAGTCHCVHPVPPDAPDNFRELERASIVRDVVSEKARKLSGGDG